MMSVIDFDELLYKITTAIRFILAEAKGFFNFLSQDYFILENLRLKGKNLIQIREYIDKQLRVLFDLNPYSKYLYFITEVFLDNFNFQGTKISSYISKNKRNSIQSQNKNQFSVNLYKPNSCIVYISLLHPIGRIKRATSSVETIFGQKKENILGQNCGILMPNIIAKFHDKLLHHFVQGGSSSHQTYLVLGQSQNGYIFPLIKRIKLDQFSDTDFGVCALFEQGYDYMLCNRKGAVCGISQKLFEDVIIKFKKSLEGLEQFDIGRFIPLTSGLIADNMLIDEIEMTTVMIIPQENKHINLFLKYKDHPKDSIVQFMKNIDKYEDKLLFYEVTIKLIKQNTTLKGLNYYYVEFQRIKRIRRIYERTEMMNTLKKELNFIFSKRIKSKNIDDLSLDNTDKMNPYNSYSKRSIFQNEDALVNLKKNFQSSRKSLQYVKEYAKSYRCSSDDQMSILGTEGRSNTLFESNHDRNEDNKDLNTMKQMYASQSRYYDEYISTINDNQRQLNIKEKQFTSSIKVQANQISNSTLQLIQNNKSKQATLNGIELTNQTNPLFTNDTPQDHLQFITHLNNQIQSVKNQTTSKEYELDKNKKLFGKSSKQPKLFNPGYGKTLIHSIQEPLSTTSIQNQDITNPYQDFYKLQSNLSNNPPTANNILNLSSQVFNNESQNQIQSSAVLSPEGSLHQIIDLKFPQGFFDKKIALGNNISYADFSKYYSELIDSNLNSQNNSNFISLLEKRQGSIELNEIEANGNFEKQKFDNSDQKELKVEEFQILRKKAFSQLDSLQRLASGYQHSQSLMDVNTQDSSSKNTQVKPIQNINQSVVINSQQLIRVQEDDNEDEENQGSNKNSNFQDSAKMKENKVNLRMDESTNNNLQEVNQNNFNDINQVMHETNSIHSSMTSTHSRKMIIINAINSKKPPLIIYGINYFGYFAYLFLCCTTIIVFVELLNQFNSVLVNFKQMTVPPLLGSYFSQSIANREFIRIGTEINLFKFTDTTIKEIRSKYLDDILTSINNFKDTYYIAVIGENDYQDQITAFAEYISQNQVDLSDVDGFGDTIAKNKTNLSLALRQLIYHLFFYGEIDDTKSSIYINQNTFTFLSVFNVLEDVSYQAALNDLNSVKSLLVSTLAIIEIVTFMVILTIFPIYNTVIKNQEKVMKLIGSFSQDKLNALIDKLDYSLTTILTKEKQKGLMLRQKVNQKRRAISSTDTLSSFSWPLIIFCILILILISLYPCFNMIFTYAYTNDFDRNLNELKYIYEVKKQLASLFSANFASLYRVLITQKIDPTLVTQLENINERNSITIQGLQSAVESLAYSRYNMGDYNSILLNILQNNACTPILDILDYISDSNLEKQNFDLQFCQQSYFNILENGIIIAIQDLFSALSNLSNLYKASSYIEFMQSLTNFKDIKGLYQLYQVELSISNLIELIKIYMINRGEDYFQYLQSLQINFFVYCQIILVLIFFVGWQVFIYKLKQSLHESKYLMSLFPLEYIFENPYIISHINQEINKQKNSK